MLARHIHLEPPASDTPAFGRERARTAIISDVYQEVRDPGCFELFNRSIDIKWELIKVSVEGADKHLAVKRNAVR